MTNAKQTKGETMKTWKVLVGTVGGFCQRGTIQGRSPRAVLKRAFVQQFDSIFELQIFSIEKMEVYTKHGRISLKLEAVK